MNLSGVLPKLTELVPTHLVSQARDAVKVGLIGRGIGGSLTPAMHREEGSRLGLDYKYVLIDFDALGLSDTDLTAVLAGVRELGFAGLNVTFPFKQQIIGLLDALSDEARMIGAVNTVVFTDGSAVGHNTDCWGFAESFRRHMGSAALDRVVQLGAGGAGAAVAQALFELGAAQLTVFDVDAAKARALCALLSDQHGDRVTVAATLAEAVSRADGIVNTTPVGMTKLPGMPLDPGLLRVSQWYADIVYFPRETELLRAARVAGCKVMPGAGMAIFQAVKAFELFTGKAPDAEAMARTFGAQA